MDKLIKQFDSNNMLSLLLDFPAQCRDAFEIGKGFIFPSNYSYFKKIVFSGMGGSAIGGEIVRSYLLYKINFPIFVIRNYTLPNFVDEETLFFACSYSGNTEETIASFYEAKERKAKIITISSGGELLNLAYREGFPSVKIPSNYPPRQALGYFVFIPLSILQKIESFDNLENDFKETISLLENMREKKLSPKISKGNIALDMAKLIKGKFPVIYSQTDYFDAVCMRWRAQLAENSKTLSSINFFPELNHNEIVGWKFPQRVIKNFLIFLIRDNQELDRIRKRIEVTKEIFLKEGFRFKEIWAEGNSLLARIFSLVYLGDFTSYYLALLNKVDPTPVEPITYLKNRLKEK